MLKHGSTCSKDVVNEKRKALFPTFVHLPPLVQDLEVGKNKCRKVQAAERAT